VLTRYRRAADRSAAVKPAISGANQDFQDDLRLLHSIIDRMPEFLGTVTPKYSSFDLLDEIRARLKRYDGNNTVIAEPNISVEADRIHLGSVINELLENTKAMWNREGSPTVGVRVELFERNHRPWVRLTYQDDGPGIPDEIREERIFQPAFSYRPGKSPGTGIGLDFAKRVAEAHGGSIRAEECPIGARFVVEIPQNPGAATL
jgi:signal transduction histidine kinase